MIYARSFLATSVKFLWGIVVGIGVSVVIMYATPGLTGKDVTDAYDRGHKEALKTNPPSEKLEAVCVGLWAGKQ